MLASLLFPYDDDAPDLISEWLDELEREGCINRYQAEGQNYIQICNWLNHQKIDKPSKSKIPKFARIREDSRTVVVGVDQGVDQGKDQGGDKTSAPKKPARFDPLSMILPDVIQPADWQSWISYRRGRRLTCSEQTIRGQLANLVEWADKGHSPNAIFKASIDNGWQGLFEPKQNGKTTTTLAQKNRQASERARELIFGQGGEHAAG